ncbi:hypothetical protein [Salinimicrobium soli]|uniref:hypothetical protein n=1 Tax=Salinimicrobium soli TaxID=1254399 RepID=UPI003AAED03A
MKNTFLVFLLLLCFSPASGFAQTDCSCCEESYRQFDFWIGEWTVYNSEGKKVGENTILRKEEGCLLTEDWKGAGGSTGSSINYFDKGDSSWHQVWVDNQGNVLNLKGKLENGKMVMRSRLKETEDGNKIYDQVSWTPMKDGSVQQLWEVYDEQENLQKTLFLGIYRK